MSNLEKDVYYKARNLNYSFFNSVRGLTGSLTNSYKSFVETDASGGETIFSMAPHFEEVYSIQLDKNIKQELLDKYTGKKIKWYSNSGSSLGSLSSICSGLDKNCFFYLNYNNYNENNDCLVQDYVKSIVSRCKPAAIIAIDSFGLINDCFTTTNGKSESDLLREKIVDSCGVRLLKNYTIGSISNGRYRLVLHLDTKTD